MITHQLPDLCARCGSPDISTSWQVSQKAAEFDVKTYLTEWFSYFVPRKPMNVFNVPICRACEDKLVKVKNITRRMSISLVVLLALLFAIVYWAAAIRGDHLFAEIITLLLITLIGALFGGFISIIFGLVIQDAFHFDFCGYDGKFFRFDNKEFRRAFTLLNPGLVKQKKKSI